MGRRYSFHDLWPRMLGRAGRAGVGFELVGWCVSRTRSCDRVGIGRWSGEERYTLCVLLGSQAASDARSDLRAVFTLYECE